MNANDILCEHWGVRPLWVQYDPRRRYIPVDPVEFAAALGRAGVTNQRGKARWTQPPGYQFVDDTVFELHEASDP